MISLPVVLGVVVLGLGVYVIVYVVGRRRGWTL